MGDYRYLMILQLFSGAAGLFFRENSFISFSSPEVLGTNANFGLSLTFQDGTTPNLVVGSPHADINGRVYRCPIDHSSLMTMSPNCERLNIDVKKLAPDYDVRTPEQPFCLGLSVSATRDFIISCAPLWTTTGVKHCYYKDGTCEDNAGSHGTCFIYDTKTNNASRFRGLLEQYKRHGYNHYLSMYGNTGFSLLADPINDLVLIGKPAIYGEIQYIQASEPLRPSQSLYFNSATKDTFSNYFKKIQATYVGHAFAGGRFFADYNNTEYAFSIQNSRVESQVGFLQYDKRMKVLNLKNPSYPINIAPGTAGDMFGAALASADVNRDGFEDLVVGAPAFSPFDDCFEAGAMYIYLGGDLKINERKYRIITTKPGSRFGTAIASYDLDGDSLPEIIVNAPFEDSKKGALYIFSGYEVYEKLIKLQIGAGEMKVPDFQLTQRIQVSELQWFGYSIQLVNDVDDNGCNELAVGSPGSSKVILFSCIPAVTISLHAQTTNKEVLKQTDMELDIRVCVKVSYPPKPKQISTKLKVACEMKSNGANIDNSEFDVDLSLRTESYCQNVSVKFTNEDAGYYYFSAKIESNDNIIANEKDFFSRSVRLSPYSKLEDSFSEMRFCSGTDCTPRLRMELFWADGVTPKDYYVDSKKMENIIVRVTNDGASSYDACVRVRITGAQVLSIPCGTDDSGMYKCNLPKPLSINKQHDFKIVVGIDKASIAEDTLHLEALLYTKCNSGNVTQTIPIDVNLIFINKNVFALGNSHNVTITDIQMGDPKFLTIEDRVEYSIVNNGSLTWPNVTAVVTVATKNITKNFTITTVDNVACTNENEDGQKVVFKCNGNLHANSTLKIIITSQIHKNIFMKHLKDNKVELDSKIEVSMRSKRLKDSKNYVYAHQKTTILFVKELSFGNNKPLIIFLGILGAIIILAVIAFILYKIGFFKRKEKERLDSLKASVRRTNPRSSERSDDGSAEQKSYDEENMDNIEITVIDNFEFDPIPICIQDDVALIEKEDVTNKSKENISQSDDLKDDAKKPSASKTTVGDASPIVASNSKKQEAGTNNSTKL